MKESDLNELETKAILALVRLAAEGNAGAAASALTAVDRVRKVSLAEMHQRRMDTMAGNPVDLCAYLATLGQTREEVEKWLGRKMSREEAAAHERSEEALRLEVRAVELGRMRSS